MVLEKSGNTVIVISMNAAQIIDEIQRLPGNEQSKVVDFMRHLPNEETLAAMQEAKHPEKLEKFDSAADMFKKLGI
jgi:antitoxin component of RelBE/YafQ-DinJ toxin-antitoxin module